MNGDESQPQKPERTPDEQAVIEYLEKSYGRALTPQEVHLTLEQAYAIDHI
jgi:hypothetical protein